jgi:hypothetical protein
MHFYTDFSIWTNDLISAGLVEYSKIPRTDDKLHKFIDDAILIIRRKYIGEIIKVYSEKLKNNPDWGVNDPRKICYLRKIMFTLKFIGDFFELIEIKSISMHSLAFCKFCENDHFEKIKTLCLITYNYTIDYFNLKNTKSFNCESLNLQSKIYDIDDMLMLFEQIMIDPYEPRIAADRDQGQAPGPQ